MIIASVSALGIYFIFFKSPRSDKKNLHQSQNQNTTIVDKVSGQVENKNDLAETSQAEKVPTYQFRDRLKSGLTKSRFEIWGKLTSMLAGKKLDQEAIDSVEELLYGADIGTHMVEVLIQELMKKGQEKTLNENEIKNLLFDLLKSKLVPVQSTVTPLLYNLKNKPDGTQVVMIVGVNGAGKTTTIGKLATKLKSQGANVIVGACDTFRAAAVDQLQVWCDRAQVQMVRAKEGAGPSGVGYDTLQTALNINADYCILDTSGRLHTKENLMEELAKSKNVLKKLMPEAPHQILLVIDAITGQNALKQAEEFHKTLGLTGIIFTKCDGTSKAGSAISIVEQLKVPIYYIGVGESVDDLDIFDVDEYLHALLGNA